MSEGYEIEEGAYLLRAQPLHNGHIAMIKYLLKKCRHCIIILGSANKSNDARNPIPIDMRREMVNQALFEEHIDLTRITIMHLKDWSHEADYGQVKTWGRFLYYNIANCLCGKQVTLFYSDNKEIMLSWFSGTEVESYVDFCFIDREAVCDGISATKVRNMILKSDVHSPTAYNQLREVVPKATLQKVQEIREILKYLPKDLPSGH